MNRKIYQALIACLLVVAIPVISSCKYDDDKLWNEVNQLSQDVAKLKETCATMNSDLSSLHTLVTALQENDFITSVTPYMENNVEAGYTIHFLKGTSVTLKNGKDGLNGNTPNISLREENGVYYWTIDGNYLKDEAGNKIKANGTDGQDGKNGITPRLKIEEGRWFLSVDDGATWSDIGQATGDSGTGIFDGAPDTSHQEYVIFHLANGTQLKLPRYKEFAVSLATTEFTFNPSATSNAINFTLTGGDISTKAQVIPDNGWKASISLNPDYRGGVINILSAPSDNADGTLSVFLSNGKGVVLMEIIKVKMQQGSASQEEEMYLVDMDGSGSNEWQYALVGQDGSSMFYRETDNNLPEYAVVQAFDGGEQAVVAFDDNGYPSRMKVGDNLVLCTNFRDNKFDCSVITADRNIYSFRDVETAVDWNTYASVMQAPETRAVQVRHTRFMNVSLSVSVMLRLFSETRFTEIVGVRLVMTLHTSTIVVRNNLPVWERPVGFGSAGFSVAFRYLGFVPSGSSTIQSYCSYIITTYWQFVVVYQEFIVLRQPDINAAEGGLISGDGDIKMTLTWDFVSDIDLHVIDPTGFEIYFAAKNAPSGGWLDYDNVYAYGPENVYWPAGTAPRGQYIVGLHHYSGNIGGNYTVVVKVGTHSRTFRGYIGKAQWVYITTVDESGNFTQDPSYTNMAAPITLNAKK